jgi:hypothetical protein
MFPDMRGHVIIVFSSLNAAHCRMLEIEYGHSKFTNHFGNEEIMRYSGEIRELKEVIKTDWEVVGDAISQK